MDLKKIQEKMAQFNSAGNNKKDIDYDAIFWRPEDGTSTIRIVPSLYDPSFPFSELKFHYFAKYPMIALSNFGKQDPVEDFVSELKKTDDKDNWSLAGKLSPKTRIFAPVVVRGEEDKGVRLWGFGITIYKALMALAEDEDIGDYTDPVTGYDLKVKRTPGNPYPETTITIKPKQTPLEDDEKLVELWLNNQPEPKESFTQYDFEYMKKKLHEHISPSTAGSDEEETSSTVTGVQSTREVSTSEVSTAKVKSAGLPDDFDEFFNLEDNS